MAAINAFWAEEYEDCNLHSMIFLDGKRSPYEISNNTNNLLYNKTLQGSNED